MPEPIDVIIPTMCDSKRGPLLLRAIDSVVSQEGVAATPVVAVNGTRFDPSFLAQLKSRTDIRLLILPEPGLFQARRAAFETIRTKYFAILDDDDIFLPGALARRLAAIESAPGIDWVVTNGAFVKPDGDEPYIPDVAAVRRNPLGTLLDHCWLCSAGNLFRTAAVPAGIFDATRSMDLTYIAFRLLAEGRKVHFVEDWTFKYFFYPDSTSKQDHYNLPAAQAIRTMMALPLPGWVRRGLAGKYRRGMHDVASYHCARGQMRDAWRAHLRSLAGFPELFRYAAFTRKLIAGSLRPQAAPDRAS